MMPRLAITLGEPAGIGPDICLKVASQNLGAELVVVGSAQLLQKRAKLLGIKVDLYEFDPHTRQLYGAKNRLAIVDIPLRVDCTPGILAPANSEYVLQTLQKAYELCEKQLTQALVTGPIHKAIIQQSGIPFSGHTEYLAKLAQVKDVLMTFYTPEFLVGMLTTHCPLNQVGHLITKERLESAIHLLTDGLKNVFHKPNPRIKILGINPHAGEAGSLGSEELTTMIPVIEAMQKKGFAIEGPVSGDTAFTPANRQNTEGYLAAFHDQGIAPIKALYFGQIVNITLGLPFLRVSVDHGTALELAGTGLANESSLKKAIVTALHYSALPEYAA
ncbi:MAG: 4-hydroxythreonine-4-phosphate dehydrogenase PdxA [Proteobacteria bacterium]|nr:4-hydroxythreonine-4-phosphate dehydrogenase PdxA [Pseudomonadota bacterium]